MPVIVIPVNIITEQNASSIMTEDGKEIILEHDLTLTVTAPKAELRGLMGVGR